jgi:chromosome segregation ATPase
VLAKLAHTMRASAEERVDWFAQEVERLNRQVAAGIESSDVELLEYCNALKTQNDALHAASESNEASWEQRAAHLQLQLDDTRFSESMLRSKVRSLQDALNANTTHSQARSLLTDALEGHAREAFDAVTRGMGTDPNGAVHQELAIKYNCTQESTR